MLSCSYAAMGAAMGAVIFPVRCRMGVPGLPRILLGGVCVHSTNQATDQVQTDY